MARDGSVYLAADDLWKVSAAEKATKVINGRCKSPDPRVTAADSFNSGWLAAGKDGLYWRTGQGIVRINGDGTLSPFVSAPAPKKITPANGPFESVGKAVAAIVPRPASGGTRGDLTLVPGRDELCFSDAGSSLKPSLDGA
ncbi:hypothetical protein OG302_40285 [Streptomyces sp. NBC_01283]|uniref:hypothetical protein n=1 Tax=Streptomyces sp. NBC_01283 TaxID=2903812 RepID=UPI00352C1A8C|nr:hypothetical protein OG302_40285 [Streptomyces sp. NBC_01283]